jgi:hypothetical protein
MLPVAAQTVAWTGSLNYSTGKYVFDERSSAVVLHNGIAARTGRLRLSLGLPVVWQNSAVVNLVGDTWIPTGGPDHRAVGGRTPGQTIPTGKGRHAGQGGAAMALVTAVDTVTSPGSWEFSVADPLLSGAAEVYTGWGALRSIELTAAVKPSFASIESGVGTGEWDWSAGASVAIAAGRALFFADASYWWLGDMPDLELIDGLGWGAGIGVPLGRRVSLFGSLAGSRAVIENVEAPLSASLAAAVSLGRGSIYAGVGAGLSEASPDLSLYTGWRVDLSSRRPAF